MANLGTATLSRNISLRNSGSQMMDRKWSETQCNPPQKKNKLRRVVFEVFFIPVVPQSWTFHSRGTVRSNNHPQQGKSRAIKHDPQFVAGACKGSKLMITLFLHSSWGLEHSHRTHIYQQASLHAYTNCTGKSLQWLLRSKEQEDLAKTAVLWRLYLVSTVGWLTPTYPPNPTNNPGRKPQHFSNSLNARRDLEMDNHGSMCAYWGRIIQANTSWQNYHIEVSASEKNGMRKVTSLNINRITNTVHECIQSQKTIGYNVQYCRGSGIAR